MEKQPLISVIVPAHNNAATIGETLQSMIDQTYRNLEIIVVDDNSTDGTGDAVKPYLAKDARISYYPLPFDDPHRVNKRGRNINAGYMSRNYALDRARGEWITFQDADDVSLLNRIEVQYGLALKYNSSHVCMQWFGFKDEYVGKKMDAEAILRDHADTVLIPTEKILEIARKSLGPIIPFIGPLNRIIPFEWKRLRVINKLFFGNLDPYPATGNSPLIKRAVIDKVRFCPLPLRKWPSFAGRGADRDFNFKVATTFKDSIAFNIPMYLWRSGRPNPDFIGYEKYIY